VSTRGGIGSAVLSLSMGEEAVCREDVGITALKLRFKSQERGIA
jgi:hypothetical protein